MNYAKQACKEMALELRSVWPARRAAPFYQRAGFARDNDILELPLEQYEP